MNFDPEDSDYYIAKENDDAYQRRKVNSQTMTAELIYMPTLWATKNRQPNEVEADKELERALMDRPKGIDM